MHAHKLALMTFKKGRYSASRIGWGDCLRASGSEDGA